jgi:hypothetical protein
MATPPVKRVPLGKKSQDDLRMTIIRVLKKDIPVLDVAAFQSNI